jgi:hypothetical protein
MFFTDTGLTRPCIYCMYMKHVTHKMRKKNKKRTWWWTITADSDWQETDQTSRQRGRPTESRQQNSDIINIWSQVAQRFDTSTYWLTDWLSVSRNVTTASASTKERSVLARPSSNCKLHTCPLTWEGAKHQETRKCLAVIYVAMLPRWVPETNTAWLADCRS